MSENAEKVKNVTRKGCVAIGVLVVLFIAGCAAPRPETLSVMERDKAIYVDEAGALVQKKERKDKVAVVVSQGDYKEYQEVAKTIDSQLTESLSAFAFFQIVERSNLGTLQQEKLFMGEDLEDGLVVPADYMITAKMNAVKVDRHEEEITITPSRKDIRRARKMGLPDPQPEVRTSISYSVSLSVDFRFYELVKKRVILTKNISKAYSGLEQSEIMSKLALAAQECVKGFSHTLGSKYAPPARVVQTRGNCEVARISMGTNYGLVKGVEVEFYEFIDNSAIIAGATRDKNVVGKGRVLEVDKNSAWVEVYDYEKVYVKRGHYVAICEDQSNRMRLQDAFRTDAFSF